MNSYRPDLFLELLHKMRGIESVYADENERKNENESGMTFFQSNDTLNEFCRQSDEIIVSEILFICKFKFWKNDLLKLHAAQFNFKIWF